MNVGYDQISCADAARMTGIEYSFLTKLCKSGRVNCTNVSDGDSKGRYVFNENEVAYLKTLKQKFGRNYMQKYRKDWAKGKQPAKKTDVVEAKPVETPVVVENKPAETPVIVETKTAVVTIKQKEELTKKRVDIDEIAIKIGYIQDIKDKLDDLDVQKNQLMAELENLRKEVMEYL